MDALTPGAGSLRRPGGLLHPHRWRLALALGLTAAACLLNLLMPLLLRRLIDGAAGDDPVTLALCAAGLLAAYVAQAAAGLGAAVAAGGVGLGLVRDLRRRLVAHL